jgi:hypothetical protein
MRALGRLGLIVVAAGLVLACGGGPCRRAHRVVDGEARWGDQPLRGADAATFQVLTRPWARDARTVWCRQKAVSGADPVSLEVFDDQVARDEAAVWLCLRATGGTFGPWPERTGTVARIPADAGTYRLLSGHPAWGVDRSGVFFRDVRLKGAEPATFRFIDDGFARTDAFLYDGSWRVVGRLNGRTRPADPDGWRLLEDRYYTDGTGVWLRKGRARALDEARLEGWERLDARYSRDRSGGWWNHQPLPDVDAATLEVLAADWARDANQVYRCAEPMEVLDPATTVILTDTVVKDAHGVWTGAQGASGARLDGADPASFAPHPTRGDHPWFRDRHRLYYDNDATHLGPEAAVQGPWAWDPTGVAFEGEVVPADGARFSPYDAWYGHDTARVFYKGEAVPGVEPRGFAVLGEGRARYHETAYRWGRPDP